jgi:hypothetical protein
MVEVLRDGHLSWWVAVVIGAVLFLWMSRALMRSLAVINTQIWDVPLTRQRQKPLLISTVYLAIAWLAILAESLFLGGSYRAGAAGPWLAILVQGICISAVWLLACLRLPDARTSWVDLIPGSLLFGFGLATLNTIGRLWLPRRFDYWTTLYGPLGVASVILGWLLIVGQLIVCSGFINWLWCQRRGRLAHAAGMSTNRRASA